MAARSWITRDFIQRGRCLAAMLTSIVVIHATPAQVTTIDSDDATLQESLQRLAPDGRPLSEVQIDPHLRELAGRLDDPSFEIRETAARELIQSTTDRLQLYAILGGHDLTVEQRYRLLQIVRDHLVNMPRGAIGIEMEGFPQGMAVPGTGVRVKSLIPKLPAERVLQVGDRIMAIDDQPLTVSTDLQRHVQSKRPGEKITMLIRRSRVDERGDLVLDANNQPVTDDLRIELELGSTELLRNASGAAPRGGGAAVMANPVEQQRAREAADAAAIFAPPPRIVAVEGRNGEAFTPSESSLMAMIARDSDQRIDAHPTIRTLIEDLLFIEQGLQSETVELRAFWSDQLNALIQAVNQPGLNAEARDYYRRVAERYDQLLRLRPQ
jgi:hypothetical protein